MKRTPGYMIGPSNGTSSVANGTTRPMVMVFLIAPVSVVGRSISIQRSGKFLKARPIFQAIATRSNRREIADDVRQSRLRARTQQRHQRPGQSRRNAGEWQTPG